MIHDSILDTIGRTPVVRINRLAPDDIDLFVKLEAFNPLSSVKDRLAVGIIDDAERRGLLQPGQTVVEATNPLFMETFSDDTDPDPTKHKFVMIRVDETWTCETLREQLPAILGLLDF